MSNRREENKHVVLGGIRNWFGTYTFSPTVRDLALLLGISVGSVHSALQDLKEDGAITFEPGKARTIELVKKGRRKA